MRPTWLYGLVLATATAGLAKDPPKLPPTPATTAGGTFLGRSGKPMARARLIVCEALLDQGKIRLLPNIPTATADQAGRFALKGFEPGSYAIVYLPAGANAAIPNEINVSALEASDRSPVPLLNRIELGTDKPNAPRPWTSQFTLMRGHTFWAMGPYIKVWNATVRRGALGPFLELRHGVVWVVQLRDRSDVKFEAWSY